MSENIPPGYVATDGSIKLLQGGWAKTGRVLIREDKKDAAVKAGWREVGRFGSLVLVERS